MNQVVQFAQTALSFLVVLGILVFVHEFGHFIVAKAFKIGVPVFSLGFGPRLWGFSRAETDYRLSAVPLGGYVRLAGDESDEARTGAANEFLSRPRWQRFLVFVAGATFNIVLAVVVMTVVFATWGWDEVVRPESYPTVSDVVPASPAEAAGLRRGDKVLRIGGQDARDQQTQFNQITLAPDQVKPIEIERDGVPQTLSMSTGQDPVYHLGAPGWRLIQEGGPPEVKMVIGGSAADAAGLMRGDKVVEIDGRTPQGELELKALLEKSIGRHVPLTILRAGENKQLVVTPRNDNGVGKIGVLFAEGNSVHHELGLGGAFAASVAWSVDTTKTVFQSLALFIKRRISVRAFSGPIEIARYSREAVRDGQTFLMFLAFISLQLGILNLMPIPVLDGGHILILGCEGVLRRDLSDKLKERVMTAGLVVLLVFFGFVLFYDLVKAWV